MITEYGRKEKTGRGKYSARVMHKPLENNRDI